MPYLYENQITFEKSVTYFRSEDAPQRVYNYNPDIKLILIIRNPVSRAITEYTYELLRKKANFRESEKYVSVNFEKTFFDKTSNIITNQSDKIIATGIYIDSYKRWLKYFSNKQILVLNGEYFINNPYNEVKMVENFLNLTSFIQKDHFVYAKKHGFYCIKKDLNGTEITCAGLNKTTEQPYIAPNLVKKLENYYKPFNEELFKLINIKPFW